MFILQSIYLCNHNINLEQNAKNYIRKQNATLLLPQNATLLLPIDRFNLKVSSNRHNVFLCVTVNIVRIDSE